jgi:anti-sigma factor RsiW
MIDCSEIRPLLSAFGDGELEPPELLKVARHLAGCPDCESEAADFGALGAGLREAHEAILNAIPMASFSEAVQARIVDLTPSPLVRVKRWFASLDDRVSLAFTLTSAALATAAITAFLLTPHVRALISGNRSQLASNSVHQVALAHGARAAHESGLPDLVPPMERALAEDSRAIISHLESENPAVAVWSEPHTDTTVIWLPDQAGR